MNLSLSAQELKKYIELQLDSFFPDKYKFKGKDVDNAFSIALERTEYCFKNINFKHYSKNGEADFQHLYSDQYCQFIYYLSNSLWNESQNKPLCDKLTLLNKGLNSFFCPYTVELPDIFLLVHPMGTVLGNAVYSDYLVILQNVTINTGTISPGDLPLKIEKGVFFSTGATIIGNKTIRRCSSIGANTLVFKKEVPENSVIFTDENCKIQIKGNKGQCKAQEYFYNII